MKEEKYLKAENEKYNHYYKREKRKLILTSVGWSLSNIYFFNFWFPPFYWTNSSVWHTVLTLTLGIKYKGSGNEKSGITWRSSTYVKYKSFHYGGVLRPFLSDFSGLYDLFWVRSSWKWLLWIFSYGVKEVYTQIHVFKHFSQRHV